MGLKHHTYGLQTPQNRVLSPREGGQKRGRRGFSTCWAVFVTPPAALRSACASSHHYSAPLYVVVAPGIGPGQSPLSRTGGRIIIRDLEYGFPRIPLPE